MSSPGNSLRGDVAGWPRNSARRRCKLSHARTSEPARHRRVRLNFEIETCPNAARSPPPEARRVSGDSVATAEPLMRVRADPRRVCPIRPAPSTVNIQPVSTTRQYDSRADGMFTY